MRTLPDSRRGWRKKFDAAGHRDRHARVVRSPEEEFTETRVGERGALSGLFGGPPKRAFGPNALPGACMTRAVLRGRVVALML